MTMIKTSNILDGLGFTECYLNQVSIETGFIKRVRKLKALDYLTILLTSVGKDVVSYNTMASCLFENSNKSVFKQALHKAMCKVSFLVFIERIFNELLREKMRVSKFRLKDKFRRIIVQDSTIIKVPKRLFRYYSGVKNGITQVANARIQLALDIKANVFTLFSIDAYSVNDLLAASELPIRKGDLIIRDRGYCSIPEMNRITRSKADFIYRYTHQYNYFDFKSGRLIDMHKLLSNKTKFKTRVRLGKGKDTIVTLVALRVPDQVANYRRRQLKQNAKHTPGKELLRLLSWSIFITSIDEKDISYKEISEVYALRWRIEIIFKSMKSHLNLDKIHEVPNHQLTFIILGKMILLLLVMQFIYPRAFIEVKNRTGKYVSLIKIVRYIKENILIAESILNTNCKDKIKPDIIELLSRYCTYDQRKDRNNYEQEFEICFLS